MAAPAPSDGAEPRPPPAAFAGGGLFGTPPPPAPAPSGSLFGTLTPSEGVTSGSFGAAPAPAPAASGSLFGVLSGAKSAPPAGLLGTGAAPSGSLFAGVGGKAPSLLDGLPTGENSLLGNAALLAPAPAPAPTQRQGLARGRRQPRRTGARAPPGTLGGTLGLLRTEEDAREAAREAMDVADMDWSVDAAAVAQSKLLPACVSGDADTVRELMEGQAGAVPDVHAMDEAPVRMAAMTGQAGVLAVLLALGGEHQVDASVNDEVPFRSACDGGHEECVRLLLALEGDRAVDVHAGGDAALRSAVRCGHEGVVRQLLALTGERRMVLQVNSDDDMLSNAAHNGHGAIVTLLLQVAAAHPASAAALAPQMPAATRLAIGKGHLPIVQALLVAAREGPLAFDVNCDVADVLQTAVSTSAAMTRLVLALPPPQRVDVQANAVGAVTRAGEFCRPALRVLAELSGDHHISNEVGSEGLRPWDTVMKRAFGSGLGRAGLSGELVAFLAGLRGDQALTLPTVLHGLSGAVTLVSRRGQAPQALLAAAALLASRERGVHWVMARLSLSPSHEGGLRRILEGPPPGPLDREALGGRKRLVDAGMAKTLFKGLRNAFYGGPVDCSVESEEQALLLPTLRTLRMGAGFWHGEGLQPLGELAGAQLWVLRRRFVMARHTAVRAARAARAAAKSSGTP